VLNHVSDTERVLASRALWFARGFQTALRSYEPTAAVSGAQADRISWAAHVEDLRCVRLATLSLFRNMPATAGMRNGIASDHRFSVRAFPYIIAGHLMHHATLLANDNDRQTDRQRFDCPRSHRSQPQRSIRKASPNDSGSGRPSPIRFILPTRRHQTLSGYESPNAYRARPLAGSFR
jgi:hypothetical protein